MLFFFFTTDKSFIIIFEKITEKEFNQSGFQKHNTE